MSEIKIQKLESTLKTNWSKALGNAEIGDDSDFFDLGGDSISALNMLFETGKLVEVELPPVLLFEHSTFSTFRDAVLDIVDVKNRT